MLDDLLDSELRVLVISLALTPTLYTRGMIALSRREYGSSIRQLETKAN